MNRPLYGGMEEKMTREAVFETLNEVFRDVFDDESISVTENTTSNDIEDWDSLEHINLLAAVEQAVSYTHLGMLKAETGPNKSA